MNYTGHRFAVNRWLRLLSANGSPPFSILFRLLPFWPRCLVPLS
ncbi:MAG TPA: hypothetical protein VFX43_22160 [Chitinophagaceae bacterium]|nr:hypothetical protein [Chitinophagaceae bacterium]